MSRMRQQLGNELPAFLRALESDPVRGVRMNPLKRTDARLPLSDAETIPWVQDAYYLSQDSEAGASILHEAGAYYIQEPGAMIPAAVLDAKPGETILDLCAAPGGKSTQMGCAMRGEGLLICNEPIPKRAQILSRNIERIGLPNCIVTCAWPEQLSRQWPEGFDAVLVDAPCSGEGMFRRDPETRAEWSAARAEGCSERQREILRAAAELVRPGGRLVYSTCTYNPQENEMNARWFAELFPEFIPEAFTLKEIDAPDGMFTCYPHRLRGEGQFTAKFRKAGEGEPAISVDHSFCVPGTAEQKIFETAFPFLPRATHRLGNTLVHAPALPDMNGIRTLRAGLHLGEIRGKTAVPDHAAALCFRTAGVQTVKLSPDMAVRYTAGETFPGDTEGWLMLQYQGLALGWGKGSGGIIKNHYPKGLRGVHYQP